MRHQHLGVHDTGVRRDRVLETRQGDAIGIHVEEDRVADYGRLG